MSSITVVVPAYNAGPALVDTARRVGEVVQSLGGVRTRAVVVVDDGSTDGSVGALRTAMERTPEAYQAVRIVVHDRRRGKGAALRTGFEAAPAVWMGFCDADGDIDPAVLADLAAALGVGAAPGEGRPADAACAVKTTAAQLPLVRRMGSVAFQLVRRAVLPLGIKDSQTGAKLFAGEPLRAVLPRTREAGFAFDMEVLAAFRAAGYGRFVGVTIRPRRVSSSSLTARSMVQLALATLRLALRYRGRRRAAAGEGPADHAGPAGPSLTTRLDRSR